MLVLVQVSSMKTRRTGSIRLCRAAHCTRRRATSGRSCSRACTVFFEAQPLGVNKVPHRAIIDLEAAPGEFDHQPTQGEVRLANPLAQPCRMLVPDRFGLVPTHLARRHAPGCPET